MKIILDEEESDEAVRADLAWGLFFGGTKTTLEGGPGMPRFAEWLWDELGERVGNFNCSSKGELRITIPSSLEQNSIDFLLRLASFWGDDVRIKRKGGTMSDNIWKKPIVNVFDDETLDGSERVQKHELDDMGSMERNFMPTLGPGRAFYSVQIIENEASTARLHSHSALDEYYLVLEGRGTLRFNGREIEVRRGDLIAKPSGPDAATHIIADKGEKMRILDMEIWHERAHFPKDFMVDPDFNEIVLRGQGWDAVVPTEAIIPSEDAGEHYLEGYKRTKDGGWVPSKLPGHRKVREK
jgi:uncharacterized cupin superfamily protein